MGHFYKVKMTGPPPPQKRKGMVQPTYRSDEGNGGEEELRKTRKVFPPYAGWGDWFYIILVKFERPRGIQVETSYPKQLDIKSRAWGSVWAFCVLNLYSVYCGF